MLRVFSVGINRYPTSPLQNCVADALLMRTLFDELYAVPAIDHRVLLDNAATKQAIRDGIEWLIRDLVPGDRCVFTYSGHGTQLRDTNGDEPDRLDEALVPVDFTWSDQFGTGLTDDDLVKYFAPMVHGVACTLLIDACHSGTLLRSPAGVPRYLAPPLRHKVMINTPATSGWRGFFSFTPPTRALGRTLRRNAVLLAACRANEVAYDGVHNGPHTAAIDAICRSGDPTYQQLKRAVRKRVLALYPQHATLQGLRRHKRQMIFSSWES